MSNSLVCRNQGGSHTALKIFGGVALLAFGVLFVATLPDLVRYMKIRAM